MNKASMREFIQNQLDERQMKSSELERETGLSPSAIRKILMGQNQNPTLETLKAVADFFKCSIDELVGNRIRSQEESTHHWLQATAISWNSSLFKEVVIKTCEYLNESTPTIELKEVISCIIEIYNYFMVKQNGVFDSKFHEWYMQKFMETK